jgi:alginate O-acetyltransferase complex protein AlgI
MLIGGLWHGANWTFVIWGAVHGFMLALERFQGKDSPYRRLPSPLRVGITFAIVCLAWVFFRAKTLSQAGNYLACLLGLMPVAAGQEMVSATFYSAYHLFTFLLAVFLVWHTPHSWDFTRCLPVARVAWVAGLLLLAVAFLWTQTENPFIYFQF